MDLSGRAPAYRGAVAICPGCGSPMRVQSVPSAEIDVCDTCGGLWLDWFDGEPHAVAAEVEADRAGTPIPPATDGVKRCPRCVRPLEAQTLPWLDAQEGELVDGVDVFRCGECAGLFLPRGSAHLLHERAQEPTAVGFWESVVLLVRRLFGSKETRL